MSSQCELWDFTLSKEVQDDKNQLMKHLNEWCKKWVFQLEKGEKTGYVHWQGRVSLIKKRRLNELVNLEFLKGASLSPTSNNTKNGSRKFSYAMKAESRVDGPWNDQDYEDPPPLTDQLIDFFKCTPYKWQADLRAMCSERDDRKIRVILDEQGNSGKSITCEWLEYQGLAMEIPPFNNMEDIMQCCMGMKPQKVYLIDMPRAMKKDKLAQFYSGLECLKNGLMYDKRYNFKRRRISRPQIFVFTNTEPNWSFLTPDRWAVYKVDAIQGLILQ